MRYLLSIKDKEVVSKFSKFTVNKNISKNRVATYQQRSYIYICIYIYIYIYGYIYIYIYTYIYYTQ